MRPTFPHEIPANEGGQNLWNIASERTTGAGVSGATVAPEALVALPGHGEWQPGKDGLRARFAAQAAATPDALALEGVDGTRITWADLCRATQSLGDALLDLGAGRGRVVLAELGNGPEAAAALYAAASVTAVMPIGAEEPEARIATFLDAVPTAAALVSTTRPGRLARLAARRNLPRIRIGAAFGTESRSAEIVGTPALPPATPTAPDDAAFIGQTSGTSGIPKLIAWSQVSMLVSAESFARWISIDVKTRGFCAMPLSHAHAHVRSLLPVLLNGGSVTCAPGLDPLRAVDWIEAARPEVMTGAPAVFLRLADALDARGREFDCPTLRRIVSGSDGLDPEKAKRISATFGVPIAEFYGQSEVSPMVAGSAPGARARTSARTVIGPVLAPWTLAFRDADGALRMGAGEGEIMIRGGLSNPVVSGGGTTANASTEGWVATGDVGALDADGDLHILGRVDTRIIRGGKEIAPEQVEAALLGHPSVAEALVFAVADPVLGARIAAAIVPASGARVAAATLQAAISDMLPDYMIPERILAVDDLPRAENGKLRRGGAAERFAERLSTPDRPGATDVHTPADPRIAELGAMMGTLLDAEPLAPDTRFMDVGGDSFLAVSLMMEIEERFSAELTPGQLVGDGSPRAIAALIAESAESDSSPSAVHTVALRTVQEGTGADHVLLAHALDGSAPYALPLARALGPEWTVRTLEAANIGRDKVSRSAPLVTLGNHARVCVEAIRTAGLKGPHVLAGHSFGAQLSYEIACQLVSAGEEVAFVGLLDDNADLEKRFFGFRGNLESVPAEFLAGRYMVNSHVLEPYPGDVWLFRAVAQSEGWLADPELGWGWLTRGRLTVIDLSSDHVGIMQLPPLEETSAALRTAIRSATGGRPAPASDTPQYTDRELDAHLAVARRASKSGDLAAELVEYSVAFKRAGPPPPLWAHLAYAEALQQAGSLSEAVAFLRRALPLAANPLVLMRRLARLARSLGDAEETARLRAAAEAHDAPNVAAKRALARWDYAEGRFAAAAERLEAALELWPDPATIRMLAKCYGKLGDAAAWRTAAERAVELSPAAAKAHLLYARALLDEEVLPEALVEVDRAIALAKMDGKAHWMRMRILEALERYCEAAEAVRKIIAIGSVRPKHYVKLGDLLDKAGETMSAVAAVEEGLERFPGHDNLETTLQRFGRRDAR